MVCETPVSVSRAARGRVLLVEGDHDSLAVVARALDSPTLEIATAALGAAALDCARVTPFDLFVIDLALRDTRGLEIVRRLRAEAHAASFIVIARGASTSTIVDAVNLGAVAVLDDGCDISELRRTVETAVRNTRQADPAIAAATRTLDCRPAASSFTSVDREPRSVAERWALLVLKAACAERDPKTLVLCARAVGVSRSALCETCRIVHVSPLASRDLARVLRAIRRGGSRWQPEIHLDISDARTLRRLERRAGLAGITGGPGPTIEEFLQRQRLIPLNSPALITLRSLLADGGVGPQRYGWQTAAP